MATRRIARTAYGFDSAPLSGLSPTWDAYAVDGVSAAGPAIAEAPAGSGIYVATLTGAAGEHITGRLDLGDTANNRYVELDEHVDDWPAVLLAAIVAGVWAAGTRTLTSFGTLAADAATAVWAAGTRTLSSFGTLVADVAAQLTTDHGAGVWGSSAAGSRAITVAVTADTDPVIGARVEVKQGATVKASLYTDGAGEAALYLDDGSYTLVVTASGYIANAGALVVTAAATVDVALTAAPAETTGGVTGRVRVLSLDADDAPNDDGIAGIVAGDSVTLVRTFTNVPGGTTIATVRATWKRPDNALGVDSEGVTISGAITNAGAGGTGAATIALTPAQTLSIATQGLTAYDVQVTLDDDTVRTPELGAWDAEDGRTTTAP